MAEKATMVPNPVMPCKVIVINEDLCTGCNMCVDVCRTDVMIPNPVEGMAISFQNEDSSAAEAASSATSISALR